MTPLHTWVRRPYRPPPRLVSIALIRLLVYVESMDCPFFLVVCRLKGFTRDLRGTQAAPSKKNSADSFLYLLHL